LAQQQFERCPLAVATLLMMALSTVLLTVAVLWPLIEKPPIRMLRA
jgi:hypothetical protein